ncbi:MAG TPA: class I SAM-dependent methyltransferase [Solirubrobacteraceae bacterium]
MPSSPTCGRQESKVTYAASVRCRAWHSPASHRARCTFLFVDGSHRYEDVLRDIDDWTSALADVATVAFHDAVTYPGVRRALEERVTPPDSPFHNLRVVEETLVADFRRPAT